MRGIFLNDRQRKQRFADLLQQGRVHEAEEALHTMKRGRYVGDLVYGANDGIITTFAVVSGAMGAMLSPGVVVILGAANLLADGFSMGASSFLSVRSTKAFEDSQWKNDRWSVDNYPEFELEQTRKVFRRWGLPEDAVQKAVTAVSGNKDLWATFLVQEELRMKDGDKVTPIKHGMATFAAFVVAGLVPLLPYVFSVTSNAFLLSGIMAGSAFFFVGASRTMVTGENPLKGGIEILVVGGSAATVAFMVGWIVRSMFSLEI